MTKEEFESLSANPGWAAMRQFLREFRADMMEQLAKGQIGNPYEGIHKCQMIADLADMDWQSIEDFQTKRDMRQ